MLTIRLATLSDIKRMREIEVDAGELFRSVGLDSIADDEPPTAQVLGAHIGEESAWVAERDGVVVGYATASVVDDEGHLDQVSLERTSAGRGIGARLIDEVCAWAAQQGLVSVTLTTFRDVPWNGPYYARLGFEVIPLHEYGQQLAAVRASERDAGLEIAPRVAMRRPCTLGSLSNVYQ